ncbi:MAG: TonB family protein [Candidatus Eisenbacteria bacterium]|nr:TonB family protein [Candidatus Eisenbacteria bacterium]
MTRSIRTRRGKVAALLGLGLLVCSTLVPSRSLAVNPIQLLQEMAETDGDDARRAKCAEALRKEPAPFVETFCHGYEAIYSGFDAVAAEYLELTLRAKPDFALACILYGDAYRSIERLDLSERYFRRAIEIQPQRIDARFGLGQVLLEKGMTEPAALKDALEAFRQMTEQDPGSAEGWSNMANVLVHMDRLSDAEMMYKKALEKEPKDPFVHDQLASLYLRQGRPEMAEASWKSALALNASYGPGVVELSMLFGRDGRLLDAIQTLEKGRLGVVAPPWGPRIRRNLGFAYLRLDDRERATALFTEAWTQGGDILAACGLAQLRFEAKDDARALGYLERAATLDAALAAPFLDAWHAQIAAADPAKYPALGVAAKATHATSGPAGVDANHALVAYVLEGWNFSAAESTRDALLDRPSDSMVADYDSPATPLHQEPAIYPESAQEKGLEGQVVVVVTIDENGKVVNAKIQASRADAELERAALNAAEKWTFAPATRYGQPVRSTLSLPFKFTRKRG